MKGQANPPHTEETKKRISKTKRGKKERDRFDDWLKEHNHKL